MKASPMLIFLNLLLLIIPSWQLDNFEVRATLVHSVYGDRSLRSIKEFSFLGNGKWHRSWTKSFGVMMILFIKSPYNMILSWILYVTLFKFISKPTSLLSFKRVSVSLFMVLCNIRHKVTKKYLQKELIF